MLYLLFCLGALFADTTERKNIAISDFDDNARKAISVASDIAGAGRVAHRIDDADKDDVDDDDSRR